MIIANEYDRQTIKRLDQERDNLRAAIEEWINYDGNDGDAIFMEKFKQILEEN